MRSLIGAMVFARHPCSNLVTAKTLLIFGRVGFLSPPVASRMPPYPSRMQYLSLRYCNAVGPWPTPPEITHPIVGPWPAPPDKSPKKALAIPKGPTIPDKSPQERLKKARENSQGPEAPERAIPQPGGTSRTPGDKKSPYMPSAHSEKVKKIHNFLRNKQTPSCKTKRKVVKLFKGANVFGFHR